MGTELTISQQLALGELPPPDQLDLVVAVPVGSGMAHDLPPGVHFNADGSVTTVVFEGAGPDPVAMAELKARLEKWGKAISAGAERVEVSATNA